MKPTILYGVTSPISLVFCQGHGRRLGDEGWDVAVVSSPGPELDRMEVEEQVKRYSVPMCREISLISDVGSLYRTGSFCFECVQSSRISEPLKRACWEDWLPNSLACLIEFTRCTRLRLETAKGLKRWILSQTERVACSCAHTVICVSPSLRARAVQLRLVDATKCTV